MLDQGLGAIRSGTGATSTMLGLWYDPDRLLIEGVYQDEITAYRARKRWMEALETNFLLEESHDFSMKVKKARGGRHYRVRCDFLTACGRYAFWRLTHHQAPEVQLMLETAHIPHSLPARPQANIFDDDDFDCSLSYEGSVEHVPSVERPDLPYLTRALRQINSLAERISRLTRSAKPEPR
jgi:hypothetical protein